MNLKIKNFTNTNIYTKNIINTVLDELSISKDEYNDFINNIFVERNVMILKKNIIDYIFKFNTNILYNILNNKYSFDICWFKYFYHLNNKTNNEVMDVYYNSKNNNSKYYYNEFQLMNGNEHLMLRDCMIEHIFERIWINIIKHMDGEYMILE